MTSRRAFGEALRRHREQRGVTLETISDITKISATLLAALERGDCSRWPGGIYSRAYIRDYAQAVGLDREDVAARFTECFTDTAFPEGAPERRDVPSAQPPANPLRLTLDEAPRDRWTLLKGRGVALALDLVLTVVLATALATGVGVGFWMAMASVSVCCHAIGVLRRGHSTSGLLARAASPAQAHGSSPPPSKPALAEAAEAA